MRLRTPLGVGWSFCAHQRKAQYYPRLGSSAGKVGTKIIGDAQVERDFRKMMETIFSLGEHTKHRCQKNNT